MYNLVTFAVVPHNVTSNLKTGKTSIRKVCFYKNDREDCEILGFVKEEQLHGPTLKMMVLEYRQESMAS